MSGEAEFISQLRAIASTPGARGLDDDCAVLRFGSETLVLTHDMVVEGTHFRADADMADVAWKLVTVNLSDLAAKGAEPVGVLLGYSLGADEARFLEGLRQVLEAYRVPLLGGDTVRAQGPRSFGLTAIGRASHDPVPDRRGAQPGDTVYVTGTLGRAMLGFEGNPAHRVAYDRPVPLLGEGKALAPLVTAMMDISDGLLLDCWRLAQASEVSIALERALIPVAEPARADDCMRWGDDYQLLFTLPAGTAPPLSASRIGKVGERGAGALLLDGQLLTPVDGLGYQH
ncbi:MAG: thiamine-phosphate kinase [Erythrobacter sp.]